MITNKSILVLLFLMPSICFSQEIEIQQEINQQVWKPFIESYSTRNNEMYSSVHSKDLIRVLRDSERIYGFEEAFKPQPDSIQKQWAVWKRELDLRFIERINSEDKAFEIGYYKTTVDNTSTGEKRVHYGKFHVLLRKENGIWKILMDADGHEGVNEEIFQTAEPIR